MGAAPEMAKRQEKKKKNWKKLDEPNHGIQATGFKEQTSRAEEREMEYFAFLLLVNEKDH